MPEMHPKIELGGLGWENLIP